MRVTVLDGRAAARADAVRRADVWIPDDASWANIAPAGVLSTDAQGAGDVLAISPILMVTDPATAATIRAGGGSWSGLAQLTGRKGSAADAAVRLAVSDPASSGDGMVAVGTLGEAVWKAQDMNASALALGHRAHRVPDRGSGGPGAAARAGRGGPGARARTGVRGRCRRRRGPHRDRPHRPAALQLAADVQRGPRGPGAGAAVARLRRAALDGGASARRGRRSPRRGCAFRVPATGPLPGVPGTTADAVRRAGRTPRRARLRELVPRTRRAKPPGRRRRLRLDGERGTRLGRPL